jgi:hypothetical protein
MVGDEGRTRDVFDAEGMMGSVQDSGLHGYLTAERFDRAERLDTDWHRRRGSRTLRRRMLKEILQLIETGRMSSEVGRA